MTFKTGQQFVNYFRLVFDLLCCPVWSVLYQTCSSIGSITDWALNISTLKLNEIDEQLPSDDRHYYNSCSIKVWIPLHLLTFSVFLSPGMSEERDAAVEAAIKGSLLAVCHLHELTVTDVLSMYHLLHSDLCYDSFWLMRLETDACDFTSTRCHMTENRTAFDGRLGSSSIAHILF